MCRGCGRAVETEAGVLYSAISTMGSYGGCLSMRGIHLRV